MSTHQTTRQSYDLFDLLFLSSSGNHGERSSPITRIVMLIGQIILATALMFILPTFIQYIVHSIDEIYLLIGRTASSPFSSIPWASLGTGIVVLLLWHVALGRISYLAVMGSQDSVTEGRAKEEDGENLNEKTSNFSWDRILSRIILPLLLLTFSISFTLNLASRLLFPKAGINTNTSLPSAS